MSTIARSKCACVLLAKCVYAPFQLLGRRMHRASSRTTSATTTRNATEGVRACCFQHSAYTENYTAPLPSVRSAQHCTAPPLKRCTARSIAPSPHSTQHCTAPNTTLHRQDKADRSKPRTARSIAQRPALHCTEHSEPRDRVNDSTCEMCVCSFGQMCVHPFSCWVAVSTARAAQQRRVDT